MLSNMLTRGLTSSTRNFSTKVLRAPMSKQSNLRMVTSLATLGLGWSCISRLNCGALFGRIKRAHCEVRNSAHDDCDVVENNKSMMSMLLNGYEKENLVVY